MGAWSENAFTPCPHCGRRFANSNHAAHVAVCVANPTIAEALKVALDYGDGTIKTRTHWNATRGALPSVSAILDQLGTGSWAAVAEHFGLTFTRDIRPAPVSAPEPGYTPIVAAGYAAVPRNDDGIFVCGLPVCRVVDYGNRVGFVLR